MVLDQKWVIFRPPAEFQIGYEFRTSRAAVKWLDQYFPDKLQLPIDGLMDEAPRTTINNTSDFALGPLAQVSSNN